jgi:hypothetical protein
MLTPRSHKPFGCLAASEFGVVRVLGSSFCTEADEDLGLLRSGSGLITWALHGALHNWNGTKNRCGPLRRRF